LPGVVAVTSKDVGAIEEDDEDGENDSWIDE
jgi:hypothetical protein